MVVELLDVASAITPELRELRLAGPGRPRAPKLREVVLVACLGLVTTALASERFRLRPRGLGIALALEAGWGASQRGEEDPSGAGFFPKPPNKGMMPKQLL